MQGYIFKGSKQELITAGYEYINNSDVKGFYQKTIRRKKDKAKLTIMISLDNKINFIGCKELVPYLLGEIHYEKF